MSYKNKKTKKNIINQLKRRIGLIKIVLLKLKTKFIKKEVKMQLPQTRSIMQSLRERSKTIRSNNLKINDWVDEYINKCILNGKPVEILTQYCLSKDLEKRFEIQGNQFLPLPAELEMFNKTIPSVLKLFARSNVSVDWYITFNDSYLDRGRVSDSIVEEYSKMIENLGEGLNSVTFYNWEKDILGGRPEPNTEVLESFFKYVSRQAFELDMKNLLERVKQYSDFTKTEEELRRELMFKIACEAEEGRFIFCPEAPFSYGDILITPLESPERLVFFETLAPDFQKRIVPILKLYPWRMDADNLKYNFNGQ